VPAALVWVVVPVPDAGVARTVYPIVIPVPELGQVTVENVTVAAVVRMLVAAVPVIFGGGVNIYFL
jgi:hypothetical protein